VNRNIVAEKRIAEKGVVAKIATIRPGTYTTHTHDT